MHDYLGDMPETAGYQHSPDRLVFDGVHTGHRVEVWWHPDGWPDGLVAWRATCGVTGTSAVHRPDKFELECDPAWGHHPFPSVDSVYLRMRGTVLGRCCFSLYGGEASDA